MLLSVVIVILSLVAVGFLVKTNVKINRKRAELLSRIESLTAEIQIAEQKNQELKSKISQSESSDYLEKVAREQLNMKKPGEEIVVITKEETQGSSEKEKSFWQKFWEKIKNLKL